MLNTNARFERKYGVKTIMRERERKKRWTRLLITELNIHERPFLWCVFCLFLFWLYINFYNEIGLYYILICTNKWCRLLIHSHARGSWTLGAGHFFIIFSNLLFASFFFFNSCDDLLWAFEHLQIKRKKKDKHSWVSNRVCMHNRGCKIIRNWH